MDAEGQERVVGLDARSEKLVFSVWLRGRTVEQSRHLRTVTCAVGDLESVSAKQTLPEDTIVLEASTNAFSIAERLEASNRRALVVKSDPVAGFAQRYCISDTVDADNLAKFFISGLARVVWRPDPKSRWMRDVFFGHRNSVKDCTRASSRIWAFCSGHGLNLPRRKRAKKVAEIRRQLESPAWTAEERPVLGRETENHEHALKVRDGYERRIAEEVAKNPEAVRLTQVLGVRFVVAFALLAFIGDAGRFATAKKLVAYIGLNPPVCRSGKFEGRPALSRCGRKDLRPLPVQAAQTAMRTGKQGMHKWARGLAARKNPNIAVAAPARKIVTLVWHILRGHTVPADEAPQGYATKMVKLAAKVGREKLRSLGYESTADFIREMTSHVVLKEPTHQQQPPGLQTVPASGRV